MRSSVVHEAIIRAESPFFEAVLSKEWKESEERVVRLPEQYPEAFDIYLRWIYSGKLVVGKIDIQDTQAYDSFTNSLSRAYILGEMLQDVDFKEAVIDGLFETIEPTERVPARQAKFLFDNTPKNAPIRRMLVDWVVMDLDIRYLCDEHHEQFTTMEFLQHVIKQVIDKEDGKFDDDSGENDSGGHRENGDFQGSASKKRKLTSATKDQKTIWDSPSTTSTCRYHEHGNNRPCYKVRFGIERPSKPAPTE